MAALTVLDILYHRLTTLLAPILVFTMEEVWLERNPDEDSSVHLQDFPACDDSWHDPELAARWEIIRSARRVVTSALELKRQDKSIGSSLEASPVVHVEDEGNLAILNDVAFDDVCITSGVSLHAGSGPGSAHRLEETPGIAVEFRPASGSKCQRCWKILPEVGTGLAVDTCRRCDDVVAAAC